MKHTAYHLRPNKIAERFAFIEAIRRLERLSARGLTDYTYFGLGGPHLEDFRLLYEFCPDIGMVSIETNKETFKRQLFHRPSSKVQLVRDNLASFITHYSPVDRKSVFWLDYTVLRYSCFEDFKALLSRVLENSMVKVTLRCEPREYYGTNKEESIKMEKVEDFRRKFWTVLPEPSAAPLLKLEHFANLLQRMLQVAAEQALPPDATTRTFVPVSSFCYSDGTGMFTLTGVVCDDCGRREVEQIYEDWEFGNLNWSPPRLIDVPVLSTKERLRLQHLLPSLSSSGTTLRQALGYQIDNSIPKTETSLNCSMQTSTGTPHTFCEEYHRIESHGYTK